MFLSKYIFVFLLYILNFYNLSAQLIFKGDRENLGLDINDQYDQVQPVLSRDGATLYFSQGSGVNGQYEIWKTKSDSVGRIVGKEKVNPLNPKINWPKYVLQSLSSHQYLISGQYTTYKNQLQYIRGISIFDDRLAGIEFSLNAFKQKQVNGLDSIFRQINIFPFYNPYQKVFLWSQLNGNQSDLYLWKENYNNKERKYEIIKLPSFINTPYNEITPWLDDEGRYLYFASNKPGGYGDMDIYVSERLDASFKNWSTPINLGPKINSNKADFNFIIDPVGTYAYFCSSKNSYGINDIFRIAIKKEKNDSLDIGSPLLLPSDKPDTTFLLRPETHLANNIVFLLDISHSMAQNRKIILLKKSMYRLVKQLRPSDKVSVVVFGTGVETFLSGQPAKEKADILDVIESLNADGGSTNISSGLEQAYELAEKHFIANGNNQLFLITDGVFNLKQADEELILNTKKILLTTVVVGNDPAISNALQPITEKVHGQMLHITNETNDLNLLLQNVRMNAQIMKN